MMVVIVPVAVVMSVVMIMVVIMRVIVARLQELRLDVEDAVEIEGVSAQHLLQRHLRSAAVLCSLA